MFFFSLWLLAAGFFFACFALLFLLLYLVDLVWNRNHLLGKKESVTFFVIFIAACVLSVIIQRRIQNDF